MDGYQRLDTYHLYEEDWDDYEELHDSFEWEIPENFNIAHYACDRWAAHPTNRIAMYIDRGAEGEAAYSYRQMQNYANQLANFFEDRGIGAGDRIAVSGEQKAELLLTHFAAWKLGASTVPLSILLGPDGLDYRLSDSAADAFVVDTDAVEALREIYDDLPSLEDVVTVDVTETTPYETDFWDAIETYSTHRETRATEAETEALLVYTSGTTGDPKGVVHAHRHLLGLLPGVVVSLRNMEVGNDIVRMIAEWSWAGVLSNVILTALYFGETVVGYTDQFDPETEFELMDRFGISVYICPPTGIRGMMQVPEPNERYDLSSVRLITMGGEAVGESLIDWAGSVFDDPVTHVSYGQTESPFMTGMCTSLGRPMKAGDNYLGVEMPGYDVRLEDVESDQDIEEPNQLGELVVSADSPSVMTEYHEKPELTAETLRDGWLYTGDVVSRDEDGYLIFNSRADDVIVSSGYRLSPEEIEEHIANHEAVVDAGVIGVPHDQRGEVPKGFVVTDEDHDPGEALREDIQAEVKNRLAKHKYPRELEFIDELPMTSTGKIRRTTLREREGVQD